jgi:hypothetical protein
MPTIHHWSAFVELGLTIPVDQQCLDMLYQHRFLDATQPDTTKILFHQRDTVVYETVDPS